MRNFLRLVLKLTVDNNKLEALLGKEPSSESTVTAEKSPRYI